MKLVLLISFVLGGSANSCVATALLPPITESEARAWSDVVAVARVVSATPLVAGPSSGGSDSIISIEFVTEGVSARHKATVIWRQALADATRTRKKPPEIGRSYRVHLRLLELVRDKADYESIHPDWGFVALSGTAIQDDAPFIEHTVAPGESLWRIAEQHYGVGRRWRVLSAANFTNQATQFTPALKSGMRLRIPTFPMKRAQPDRSTE